MSYDFRTIVVPGAYSTEVTGINNTGEVAGSYAPNDRATASQLAFTETGGSFSFAPDGTFPLSREYTGGINNLGQVAATSGGGTTTPVGVVWSPGAPSTIIGQAGTFIHALDVNDSGVVVGWMSPQSSNTTGFIYQNGTMTPITVPNASTAAYGINNEGWVVGTANNYGFIDIGGQVSLIGIAGASSVVPMDITDAGVVVGSYYDGTHWHGWVDDGAMHFIDRPDASDTLITGINSGGTIVGYSYATSFGPTQGFVASDPDPVTTMVREDYVGLFGHDADPGAAAFWTKQLETTSMTARDFVWALTQSDESQALHGGQTGEQFVNSVYENALGRPAEANAQTAWAGVMRAGAGSWDVLSAITTSPEGQIHFAATHS